MAITPIGDNTINVDVINEQAANAGVTIDGVLIKDGGLTATAGAITTLTSTTILGPTWQNWTPTLTGGGSLSLSTTSATGRYLQVGKVVFFLLNCQASGTGSTHWEVNSTLPVTSSALVGYSIGTGQGYNGSAYKLCYANLISTTSMRIYQYDLTHWGTSPNLEIRATGFYIAA